MAELEAPRGAARRGLRFVPVPKPAAVLMSAPVPELPEVETVRRSLEARLVGHRVVGAEARKIRLREGIEPGEWEAGIVGRRLLGLERRAKYILARFEASTALFHLGMSGRLVVALPDDPREPHTHLVLRFDHGRELRLVDPRRFGVAIVLSNQAVTLHPGLQKLGTDPLLAEAAATLRRRAGRSRVAIRNLLLDQNVLAGVGNIYANEALARAGIHPLRAASSISTRRLDRLAESVREVLEAALRAGGTTLDDGGFVDADGRGGYFAVELMVYGREGEACPRCGARIARRNAGGRSVYFCPRCQR